MGDESAKNGSNSLVPVVNTTSAATDAKSPYYLHPSDHPGLTFVTQPLHEAGINYFAWKRTFLTALRAKNKADFVDGSVNEPEEDSNNHDAWLQCDAFVKTWLINALSPELQATASHADTAREVWRDMEERFTQGIAPRVYQLRRAIASLRQDRAPVSTYYGKLKQLWNELRNLRPMPACTCETGKKIQGFRDEELVYDFLMGLDDDFSSIRSQILSVDPLPTIGRAYALVAGNEKQRVVSATNTLAVEGMALLVRDGERRPAGDRRRTDRGSSSSSRQCAHCGKTGHEKDQCYALIGYPDHWTKPAALSDEDRTIGFGGRGGRRGRGGRGSDRHVAAAVQHEHNVSSPLGQHMQLGSNNAEAQLSNLNSYGQ